MADTSHRAVTIERIGPGRLVATNPRGGSVRIRTADSDFTPVELLLAAIGGCTALDVDALTARRAEPEAFTVEVTGEKVRDAEGNRLEQVQVTFRVTFPDGAAGDAARAALPDAVRRSHERLCTVTRTVERGTPVSTRIAEE